MGEGDVKLMGAIGAFCGWQGTVFALFGGAVLGTLVYGSFRLAHAIVGRNAAPDAPDVAAAVPVAPSRNGDDAQATVEPADEDDMPDGAIPFGPALAGGAILYLFYFKPFVAFYFHDLREILLIW
jgi:leader peptidase (prepilin peptidase)/N-methyltransferase